MPTETAGAENQQQFPQPMQLANTTLAKTVAEDFTRLISELKVSGTPGMELMLTALKRNMETMSAVNRVAVEGAHAVARRHMEILQQTMTELTETLRSLAALTDTPQMKAAKQAELIKKSYENAIATTRDLGGLIQRSNTEAMELLSHRFSEALEEVKAILSQPNHAVPSTG
jgi:phasin family protein